MSKYRATIGLEIHAELKTNTKMFCDCKNDPDEGRPNWNICPVCTAQPGTLPAINKKAVEHVLRVGKAVAATLADFTEWDRKNYFYPDIPKGYQISQYKYPLVSGGELAGVGLTRVHLEEDTGTSIHDRGDYSLIDYNRAGVPLMELVTEPVIHDAETAVRFAKELQLLLRYLGASDANMEKGEMRVEANISIAEEDAKEFGTKVEVKNLNSFKSVGDAIAFELKRHEEMIGRGEKVAQETRGWDENAGKTFSQRKKESAHDYRYFPEPDLPKLVTTEVFGKSHEKLDVLPELPWVRRNRLKERLPDLPPATLEIFVSDRLGVKEKLDSVMNSPLSSPEKISIISNLFTRELQSLIKEDKGDVAMHVKNITLENLFGTAELRISGGLSSTAASQVFAKMYQQGGTPKDIAESEGLLQKNDAGALEAIVNEVIAANEKVAAEYKGGKQASLQFLIGQGMKLSKGSANPQVLAGLFRKILG